MAAAQYVLEIEIRNIRCVQVSALVGVLSYELWINGSFFAVETQIVTAGPDNDNGGGGIPLAA